MQAMRVIQLIPNKNYSNGPWPFRITVKRGRITRYYFPKNARGRTAEEIKVELNPSEEWPDELQIMNGRQAKKYRPDKSTNKKGTTMAIANKELQMFAASYEHQMAREAARAKQAIDEGLYTIAADAIAAAAAHKGALKELQFLMAEPGMEADDE